MKIKNKRILKNGAIGAYVYYSKDKKWKWRIIGNTKKKGGNQKIKIKFELIKVPHLEKLYGVEYNTKHLRDIFTTTNNNGQEKKQFKENRESNERNEIITLVKNRFNGRRNTLKTISNKIEIQEYDVTVNLIKIIRGKIEEINKKLGLGKGLIPNKDTPLLPHIQVCLGEYCIKFDNNLITVKNYIDSLTSEDYINKIRQNTSKSDEGILIIQLPVYPIGFFNGMYNRENIPILIKMQESVRRKQKQKKLNEQKKIQKKRREEKIKEMGEKIENARKNSEKKQPHITGMRGLETRNIRTNEQTNQRMNQRTNEPTNEPTISMNGNTTNNKHTKGINKNVTIDFLTEKLKNYSRIFARGKRRKLQELINQIQLNQKVTKKVEKEINNIISKSKRQQRKKNWQGIKTSRQ